MAINHETLSDILTQITEQPPFRVVADREMDYADNNQHDSKVLAAQKELGIPPAIEPIIGPVMQDIEGIEVKNRTDWIVNSDKDGDEEGENIAKATSYKLNQAERRSGADVALTSLYESVNRVGFGFVEVGRETNPFKFPYKVEFIHRNEIYWDWYSTQNDLLDSPWILRRKWSNIDTVAKKVPGKKEFLQNAAAGWGNEDDIAQLYTESGGSTGLAQSLDIARGWSVEEQEWLDPTNKRICLYQLDTLETEEKDILFMRDGRRVEFDMEDPYHIAIVVNELGKIERADVEYIQRTIFAGPEVIQSERLEFDRYPIVSCFGRREDRTKVPYGGIRPLMYMQDEINARVSKMQWLLSSVVTTRTDGVVMMPDELFRQMVARPNADIILSQKEMAKAGAVFKIERNPDLNRQQYERLLDLRESIKRISGVSDALSGDASPDNMGGLSQMIEQSMQSLSKLNDSFSSARKQVGELLLGMIIRDIGKDEHQVTMKRAITNDPEIIVLNARETGEDGAEIVSNDVQQAMLRVEVTDVPSTQTYKQHQLNSMTEVMKSSGDDIKSILMPHFMSLTNVPNKEEIVAEILALKEQQQLTPEQVEQQVKAAVEEAKIKWMTDIKEREVTVKENKSSAEIEKIVAESQRIASEEVNTKIESIYSAVQAVMQLLQGPEIASGVDQVLKSSGFEDSDSAPIVANPAVQLSPPEITKNTSPMFPGRVQEPDIVPVQETAPLQPESAAIGVNDGIEAPLTSEP